MPKPKIKWTRESQMHLIPQINQQLVDDKNDETVNNSNVTNSRQVAAQSTDVSGKLTNKHKLRTCQRKKR